MRVCGQPQTLLAGGRGPMIERTSQCPGSAGTLRGRTQEASPVSVLNATPRPRRVRVERGIYRRPSDGKYEFCYQGSDGKTHWKTIDGGLREARAERGDVLGKLGR